MVVGRLTYILKVACPEALLKRRSPFWTLDPAQEFLLKLVHASPCKKKRLVIRRHQRIARIDPMSSPFKKLKEFISKGLSAAIYTQTTDVEGEVNGLLTYDREIIKFNEAELKELNSSLFQQFKNNKLNS